MTAGKSLIDCRSPGLGAEWRPLLALVDPSTFDAGFMEVRVLSKLYTVQDKDAFLKFRNLGCPVFLIVNRISDAALSAYVYRENQGLSGNNRLIYIQQQRDVSFLRDSHHGCAAWFGVDGILDGWSKANALCLAVFLAKAVLRDPEVEF